MSGSTEALAALGGTVVLLSAWAVVLSGRAPRQAHLPLGLIAFADAWALCLFLSRSEAPRWTSWAAALAVLISIVVIVVAAQRSVPREGGGGDADDGDGGLGKRPPDGPIDGGSPTEPAWWPEFERELARYTAQRERARREAAIAR